MKAPKLICQCCGCRLNKTENEIIEVILNAHELGIDPEFTEEDCPRCQYKTELAIRVKTNETNSKVTDLSGLVLISSIPVTVIIGVISNYFHLLQYL